MARYGHLHLVAYNPLIQPLPSLAPLTLAWSSPLPELDTEEQALVKDGHWVRAVVLYRARTGRSLSESKRKVRSTLPR